MPEYKPQYDNAREEDRNLYQDIMASKERTNEISNELGTIRTRLAELKAIREEDLTRANTNEMKALSGKRSKLLKESQELFKSLEELKKKRKEKSAASDNQGHNAPQSGPMANVAHINDYQIEAVCGAIITILFFEGILAPVLMLNYRDQDKQWQQALKTGTAYAPKVERDQDGNIILNAEGQPNYLRKADGSLIWPVIHPLDNNGELDYSKEITDGKCVDRNTIRKNRDEDGNALVPSPSFSESMMKHLTQLTDSLYGATEKANTTNAAEYAMATGANQAAAARAAAPRPRPGGQ